MMYNKGKNIALIYLYFFIFLETIYRVIVYGIDKMFNIEFFISLLFIFSTCCFLSLIGKFFPRKGNVIFFGIIVFLFCLIFCIDLVFYKTFSVHFSISYLNIADQLKNFTGEVKNAVLENILFIFLLFAPFISTFFIKSKIDFERRTFTNFYKLFLVTLFFTASFYAALYFTGSKTKLYDLFYKENNLALTNEKAGMIVTTYLDINRFVFGFNEKIIISNSPDPEEVIAPEYEPNYLNINFDEISSKTTNKELIEVTNYYKNDKGTLKNEYTGYYKGKNLIFIIAESFNEIAVSEELTPTLYKLVNESFVFENFYTPVNSSTIGGEFQILNGQFADVSYLSSSWRKANISTPYGIGNIFNDLNYKTYAFHNGEYYFQDRNDYLKMVGFNNYIGCGNGMEKLINCSPWPRSDLEMFKATTPRYILTDDSSPFMTYFMTNSGHFPYQTTGVLFRKYREQVQSLPYSGAVKAYLASQIDLDLALKQLIDDLTVAQKLDDTVIILVADHYPYDLTMEEINELSSYTKDDKIEVNRSNLIIWNSKTPTIKVKKIGSQLDVIPTVYNLFGIPYDSRLFSGKDILSTEPGLAFFNNRSWVSDLGRYESNINIFTPNEGVNVDNDYVSKINTTVANRINLSKLILKYDYYKLIGGK